MQVIPALLIALDDYDTPRVQTHAGAALVNFSEQCPKSLLVKYLPVIVEKMQKVLQVRLDEVREEDWREGGREEGEQGGREVLNCVLCLSHSSTCIMW